MLVKFDAEDEPDERTLPRSVERLLDVLVPSSVDRFDKMLVSEL